MAKRKRGFTDDKYAKKLKEGRGSGHGSDYKPWITIQDVPSNGRSTRLRGITVNRQHEFLSDMERNYFLIVEFSDRVKDIKEQYPLLPREETIEISNMLGIKHPTDPNTLVPIVMTTDFFLTAVKDGKLVRLARTIKSKNDLENTRQLEKFEIERVYWERRGIDWGIVTEAEIDKVFAHNVMSVHKFKNISDKVGFDKLSDIQINKFINNYIKRLNGESTIREISDKFDDDMLLETGSGLTLFKHLIINHLIEIDMTIKLNTERKIEISIKSNRVGSEMEAI